MLAIKQYGVFISLVLSASQKFIVYDQEEKSQPAQEILKSSETYVCILEKKNLF